MGLKTRQIFILVYIILVALSPYVSVAEVCQISPREEFIFIKKNESFIKTCLQSYYGRVVAIRIEQSNIMSLSSVLRGKLSLFCHGISLVEDVDVPLWTGIINIFVILSETEFPGTDPSHGQEFGTSTRVHRPFCHPSFEIFEPCRKQYKRVSAVVLLPSSLPEYQPQ